MNASRGMAAVLETLARRYDVKVVCVQASASVRPTEVEFTNAIRRFNLTTLPGFLGYKVRDGRLVYVDRNNGGITSYDPVNGRGGYLRNVPPFSRFVETRLLE